MHHTKTRQSISDIGLTGFWLDVDVDIERGQSGGIRVVELDERRVGRAKAQLDVTIFVLLAECNEEAANAELVEMAAERG